MQQFGAIISQNQKLLLYGIGLTLLCYYLLMDGILYSTLQSIDLVSQKETTVESWSPFHPLSVKLIMTDPSTHYILTPLSEHFNSDTNFSKTFYFITPNMITFSHLIVAFIAAKFVFSDSLQSRRIGVLIYQFRSFLDAFDGTIYRSHASYTGYKSHHSNLGFWIDSVTDTIDGLALLFAVLFYLWWKCPPGTDMIPMTSLPWNSDGTCDSKVDLMTEKPVNRSYLGFGKQFIFWRCFCIGLQTGVASALWDQLTMQYEKVFMVKLEDPDLVHLQSVALHSATTWLVFWFWRIFNGQSLEQMLLLAIFTDKVWEFLRLAQYTGFIVIGVLAASSYYHVTQISAIIDM